VTRIALVLCLKQNFAWAGRFILKLARLCHSPTRVLSADKALAIVACCTVACFSDSDWLQFRGPHASNVVKDSKLPTELGDPDNIAWKVELPGKGPSSPIVIGDKVVLTCSAGVNQDKIYVCCYSSADGKQLWKQEFWATGRSFCHPLSANAAPTPVSDGKNVYAFFSSNDLVCLDLDGKLQWYRGLGHDHPKAGHDTGMSSSPVLVDGVLICQVENQGDSFAIGIDAKTGKTVWQIERSKDACWASPIVIKSANGSNVLLQSVDRATLVNAKTGEKVWEVEGRCNPISSTTMNGEQLYLPMGGTAAYQVSADGTLNELWKSQKISASRSSLLADNNNLYTVAGSGIVNCFDANEQKSKWKVRVGGTHWTTPLIAGDHMYLFSQEGTVTVVDLAEDVADDTQRKVYEHSFEDEVFLASPAVAGDALFMRSDKHLYKFR